MGACNAVARTRFPPQLREDELSLDGRNSLSSLSLVAREKGWVDSAVKLRWTGKFLRQGAYFLSFSYHYSARQHYPKFRL